MDQEASLFVDCTKVSSVDFDLSLALIAEFRPIGMDIGSEVKRTRMSTRDVATGSKSEVVPLDVQFFVIHCEPSLPEQLPCTELLQENDYTVDEPMDEPIPAMWFLTDLINFTT